MVEAIKIENFKIENLVREALSIPGGWKEEIYVENGEVSFSDPMTGNTYTAQRGVPVAVADLEALSIGDFEGFYLRKNGKVERDARDEFETEKGEYYGEVEIMEYDDAVHLISVIVQDSESSLNALFDRILEEP